MRKHTIVVLLLILLSLLFLSGCINIEIEAGIDEHFTSYLIYHIELDAGELDERYQNSLRRALNEIGWNYQEEHDFVVSFNTDSMPYVLTMTRRIENNSFEQAYRSLEALLTNENITPFMTVGMAFEHSERQSRYIFEAMTDIPQIMRLSNAEELTPELQQQLEDAIATGDGSVTIKIPVSELVSSSHSVNTESNRAIMKVPLSYTSQTELELSGIVNIIEDGVIGGLLGEIIDEQYKLRNKIVFICAIVFAILLLIMLMIILVRKSKSRRYNGM
ncbi:MAG: hypothetical protein FWE83_08045 [Oscillospiraceae bacterium]|nr:hypothetical protein [Oscillospiraceae bacterium]